MIVLLIPLFFSIHQILVRKGGEELDALSGTYLSLIASTLLFSPSIAFANFDPNFLVPMVLAGFLHFFLARLCFYHAIERIGVNLSSPLSATRIYFAAILGYLIGEFMTLKLLIMTVLIFLGVLAISNPKGKIDLVGLFLGISTGFLSALSSFFIKIGLLKSFDPLFGAFVGFLVSTLLLTPIAVRRIKKFNKYYFLAGFFVGLGHLIRYICLYNFQISVVESVTSSYPMFTLALSYLFLREREVFSFNVIIGAVLILLGINVYFL